MNWLKALADAASIEALLGAVNEYVLQQSDEFWSWIPRGCRPGLMASEEDIHFWHRKLAEAIAQVEAPNIRMQDLCVYFVRASARALEIRAAAREKSSNHRHFEKRANGAEDTLP